MKNNLIGLSGKMQSGKDLVGKIIRYFTSDAYKSNIPFEKWDEEFHATNWKIVKFADKLKDIICLLTGCTRLDLESDAFKDTELGMEWWKYPVEITYPQYYDDSIVGYDQDISYFSSHEEADNFYEEQLKRNPFEICKLDVIKPTYRYLLQHIGTDLFRNQLHPNTWVNATMVDYKLQIGRFDNIPIENSYPDWIITDVRFENEVEAIHNKGGIVIRINRTKPKVITGNITTDIINNTKDFGKVEHQSETALDRYNKFDYVIENDGTIDQLIDKVKIILQKEKII